MNATLEWGRRKRDKVHQSRASLRNSIYTIGKFRKELARVTGKPAPVLSTEYKSDGGWSNRELAQFGG